jgi:hypothetical protein
MSTILTDSIKEFRSKLQNLSREELLEIIRDQDPDTITQIERIEYVFKYKLRHLNWGDGSPVNGKPLTNSELILLIDPPFIYNRDLAKQGFSEEQQRMIHIASDPVLWAKHFLKDRPRVYQTLILRHPNSKRIMRFGRRMGKTITMAFFSLWYAYTHVNGRVLVVAPMKSQVGVIYGAILEMAMQNEIILNKQEVNCAIVRKVASPQYEINFDNGSTIKFFTSGMKSNNKSDVARGQEADVIILDEMDYMGPDDLIALLAMMQGTDPKKRGLKKQLIAASTPTGQRNTFWQWNEEPEFGFASYWFPSYANPEWGKEMEAEMRLFYPNEQNYRHEVEADWGEDVEGVYPHKYVQLAFQDPGWSYKVDITSANSFYIFGVDWDKYGAGVNIVILEVCNAHYEEAKYANKVRLIYREEIDKGEFTYTGAVDRLIELNDYYNPRHIYVDRGAGEVQVELLHKYGLDHKNSGLHKKVKGIQFSQSIEVRDPHTKEFVKKDIKPFMVDNLYQMLEREQIVFSGEDSELFVALLSYIVLRMSANNKPVFAPGGQTKDHAHDALILACFALAENYDELLNPIFASKSFAVSHEVFLPTFEVNTEEEREIARDVWGSDTKGPVSIRRSMAYNIQGRRNVSRDVIKRKSF